MGLKLNIPRIRGPCNIDFVKGSMDIKHWSVKGEILRRVGDITDQGQNQDAGARLQRVPTLIFWSGTHYKRALTGLS